MIIFDVDSVRKPTSKAAAIHIVAYCKPPFLQKQMTTMVEITDESVNYLVKSACYLLLTLIISIGPVAGGNLWT